eukprot:25661-Eustigmatos_ZCMA.PRE.1
MCGRCGDVGCFEGQSATDDLLSSDNGQCCSTGMWVDRRLGSRKRSAFRHLLGLLFIHAPTDAINTPSHCPASRPADITALLQHACHPATRTQTARQALCTRCTHDTTEVGVGLFYTIGGPFSSRPTYPSHWSTSLIDGQTCT